MKEKEQNKMAVAPMNRLFWKMGLPMIISMVLQALYNVIDSIFVANMEGTGAVANQALTYAFPVQIMIIAVGVGTGVGLNALLSKSLGENNREKANKAAGNGIFLSLCIYAVFLVFGLFGSHWFISLFTKETQALELGTTYLRICTCLSLGSIGFTVYERFLQATGKTIYILDEPTTGLHTHDVKQLLEVLQRLVDQGNTVVVIEHNLDVIKCADHLIDLGPEGGDGGGTIVCTGTPEEVAACPESYTGQYLKKILARG